MVTIDSSAPVVAATVSASTARGSCRVRVAGLGQDRRGADRDRPGIEVASSVSRSSLSSLLIPILGIGKLARSSGPVGQHERDPLQYTGPVRGHPGGVSERGEQAPGYAQTRFLSASFEDLASYGAFEAPRRGAMTALFERYCARVGEPVLDRHVNVAQLWQLACDAVRKGEKWGQRKKSVSDAMESYYTQLRRDKRGAKRWVAAVVDVLGFFDPSADWRAVEVGLQMLDQADGDVTGVGAELQRLEIVPASSTKNSLYKSV